jgi:hypothetical protein
VVLIPQPLILLGAVAIIILAATLTAVTVVTGATGVTATGTGTIRGLISA